MVKTLPANAGDAEDTGSIPGLGRASGGENGNSLQYSCQNNPIDRRTWLAIVGDHKESRLSSNQMR